jgi:hypothetical protein
MQVNSQPANQQSCNPWGKTKRVNHNTYSFKHTTGAAIGDERDAEKGKVAVVKIKGARSIGL